MNIWTILLARPDYIANDSLDTYLTTAEGDTPQAAVDAARLEAATADDIGEGNLTDYAVLFICAGTHPDLSHFIDQGE